MCIYQPMILKRIKLSQKTPQIGTQYIIKYWIKHHKSVNIVFPYTLGLTTLGNYIPFFVT